MGPLVTAMRATPERWALFVLSALLAVLPFFVVTIPPITDLPQHLAKIRLLGTTLADPNGADLGYFDYVLVNGTPDAHREVATWRLAPVTTTGSWRLYRVTR